MNAKIPTILIVDDEPDLREAIAFDFRRRNFNVLTASSGNEAIKLVESSQIDVVLTDVRMPNGDGVELLDRIKARNVFLPVVMFITGFSDMPLEEAYDRGADAVFSKPFDRKVLFEAVSRVIQPYEKRFLRKASRIDIEIPIGLNFVKSNFLIQSTIRNLGRGGVFVELAERFPETLEEMEFKFESGSNPELKIAGRGIVRWIRKEQTEALTSGCGIEFVELDSKCISRLVEAVNCLKTKAFIPRK